MAQLQTQSIPHEQFLLICINLLHRAFIESARTDAKNVYREISSGKAIHLTTVEMEDKSTSRFNLSLDQSEFRGKLNYGAFRASLSTLLSNITQALRNEKDIKLFDNGQADNCMIFGIMAVTVEEDQANVMVLGAEPGGPGGGTLMRLMYLEPGQFAAQQTADAQNPGAA